MKLYKVEVDFVASSWEYVLADSPVDAMLIAQRDSERSRHSLDYETVAGDVTEADPLSLTDEEEILSDHETYSTIREWREYLRENPPEPEIIVHPDQMALPLEAS